MGKFTVIPENTFKGLQLDAGVLLNRFNPENPVAPADEDIICATTGGINPSCVPTYSDQGEDVDNVQPNMKEFKKLDEWKCSMSTTSIGTTPELIKLALGCADIDAEKSMIVPRMDLSQDDFTDIWWVGDRADGGMVAIQLKNALSTSGFSIKTGKNAKGTIPLELDGHVSIKAQKEAPMVFYSADPPEGEFFTVQQILNKVTSSFVGSATPAGEAFTATLTADEGFEIASVIVISNGVDVTATAYTDATGTVSIAEPDGSISIYASAVATGA